MHTRALEALRLVARTMKEQAARVEEEPEIADWLDGQAGEVTSFLARVELEGEGGCEEYEAA